MLTATVDTGDWYPAFDPDVTNYKISVANGSAAPVVTYTIAAGTKATIGEEIQTPNEEHYTVYRRSEHQFGGLVGCRAGDETIQWGYHESCYHLDDYTPKEIGEHVFILCFFHIGKSTPWQAYSADLPIGLSCTSTTG